MNGHRVHREHRELVRPSVRSVAKILRTSESHCRNYWVFVFALPYRSRTLTIKASSGFAAGR